MRVVRVRAPILRERSRSSVCTNFAGCVIIPTFVVIVHLVVIDDHSVEIPLILVLGLGVAQGVVFVGLSDVGHARRYRLGFVLSTTSVTSRTNVVRAPLHRPPINISASALCNVFLGGAAWASSHFSMKETFACRGRPYDSLSSVAPLICRPVKEEITAKPPPGDER